MQTSIEGSGFLLVESNPVGGTGLVDIAYQRTLGFRSLDVAEKATPQTPYNVASVTKVFTALLAVTLHDRGVVDLDQPVSKYLPGDIAISTRPKLGATITLRQLASHTSGLPRGVPGPVQTIDGRYHLEPKLLYAHLANVELVFDPGTDELYSNLAMGLLGHVLELATDKSFDRLLKEVVCDPLKLKNTAILNTGRLPVATGYCGNVPRRQADYSHLERLAPSGGLVASTEDLAHFLVAHMKPGVLSDEILAQLLTPTKLLDGSASRTGLGWEVRERASIGRILKKNGGRNNCSAWIGFAPAHGVGVVVITNCGGPAVDSIGYWLLERSVPKVMPSLLDRKPVEAKVYARVAPFTGVRWENDRPIVRVQDRWSPLVSIDGVPIERIIEFARQEFRENARKRIAEDLVEVLSVMGHEPKWTVTLGLEMSDGVLEKVQLNMTEHNRHLVLRQITKP